MARYLCNDRFFNDRLYYEGEVYDLEPSEVKRITASRQMHHLRALQPELAEPSAPNADPLDELAKSLTNLNAEEREGLSDRLHKLEQAKEEKVAEADKTTEAATQSGTPPATGPTTEGQTKPITRSELEALAEKKGIKTMGLTKAQIAEKLAQAAPGA